jgi:hypothetical protein
MLDFFSRLLIATAWIAEILDETNLIVLAVIALIAQAIARDVVGDGKWRSAAKFLAWTFFVAYTGHLTQIDDFSRDAAVVFVAMMRSGLASVIVFNIVLLPLMYAANLAARFLQSEWGNLKKSVAKLFEKFDQPPTVTPVGIPAAVPPREQQMQLAAVQAKLDFDFESQIIESAGLDADEMEVALTEARQKYLQRLRDAMQ